MGRKGKRRRITRALRKEIAARANNGKSIERQRRQALVSEQGEQRARITDARRSAKSADPTVCWDRAVMREPALGECGERLEQVRGLYLAVTGRRPRLADAPYVRLLPRLAHADWRSDPGSWEPEGRGSESAVQSLVAHLLGPYPVPQFLIDSLMRPSLPCGDVKAQVGLIGMLADGQSVYRHARGTVLPEAMTRRMCHELLQTPVGYTMVGGIRRAQALCHGGSHALQQALTHGWLGETRQPENFWDRAIHWFCRQQALDVTQIDPVCDYLAYEVQRNPEYSFAGRTWCSVMRSMELWHRMLARQNAGLVAAGGKNTTAGECVVYKPSGLRGGSWTLPVRMRGKEVGHQEWVMREILDSHSLLDEGRAMCHCVSIYGRQVRNGGTSIWSLLCNRKRKLTLEVDNRRRAILQIRGKSNRLAESGEFRIVRTWADQNRLLILRQ